jgi:prolyl oligopeptidase
MRSAYFVVAVVLLSVAAASAQVQGKGGITLPNPPVVKTEPVVDEYQSSEPGLPTKITDPYRWLEDAHSPETRAYITAQNAYTAQYFSQVKMLPAIVKELGELLKTDFVSVPTRRGDRYFFSKRAATENQASIYMRVGLHGPDEKLIDASKLSTDQNTSVNTLNLTEDGSMMAYGVRVGGADEVEVHFLDVATRKDTGDVMPRARYSGVDISPDKAGVYYSKLFPREGNRVFYHKFGTPLDSDAMILGKEYRGEKLGEIDGVSVRATANGHFLVFRIGRGVPATREDILIKDLRVPDSPIVPLVYGINNRFGEFSVGDTFYMRTDYKAPNGRILKVVQGKGPDEWPVVIPEGKDVLESVNVVGGKMYVLRLKDVKSDETIYSLEGKAEGHIVFPGIGAGSTLAGRAADTDGFYTFQSIITPPTIFHYDTKTGRSEVFYSDKVPFDPAQFEVKQVFFTSKDGTKVPMFLAGKKSLKRDGTERLLMTGYGGFALSETPVWNPEYAWWMQEGGWFALPNLRGGN